MTPRPQECKTGRKKPVDLEVHQTRNVGVYLRHVERKNTKRWVEKDERGGFRPKVRGLSWSLEASEYARGLSVECARCVPDPRCPAVLGPKGHDSVAAFDIERLSSLIGQTVEARWVPTEEPGGTTNWCHFCLVGDDDLEVLRMGVEGLLDSNLQSRLTDMSEEELEHWSNLSRAIYLVVRGMMLIELPADRG